MSFNRISAAEAASLIKHGYNIGLSGFTPAGTAKAVTAELAKIAEKNGAAAITVHGRTRMQMYSGKVDYDIIAKVKKAVDIPVIANGDIVDEQSAAIMFEKTNCDAIMIGRGALGNPWIFRRINAYLNECRVLPDVSINEKMVVMLKHIQKIIEYKGEYTAMREARHHAAYYTCLLYTSPSPRDCS